MKNMTKMLCLICLGGSIAYGGATPLDLSSPKKALNSYISLKSAGATLREFQNAVSKEYTAIVFALDVATQGKSELDEKMPPENKYEKIVIVSQQSIEDRAIFQVKVKYKDSWLKKEAEEMKAMGMSDDIPADKKTGGKITDSSPGEETNLPYHIKGEGFVSFLFVKQDTKWLFHKSYASNQPSDFTPLLKAQKQAGESTLTAKPGGASTSPSGK